MKFYPGFKCKISFENTPVCSLLSYSLRETCNLNKLFNTNILENQKPEALVDLDCPILYYLLAESGR